MTEQQLYELLKKYTRGDCTADEKASIETWYLKEAKTQPGESRDFDPLKAKQEIWSRIESNTGIPVEKGGLYTFRRWYIAASVVLFLASACLFFYLKPPAVHIAETEKRDINPGSDKAVLTLANGSKIILNNATTGKIAREGSVVITKSPDGQLIYTVAATESQNGDYRSVHDSLAYNTITTPRGGQYQVVLPDGSHLWLNAESSVKFPAIFRKDERRVAVTGEVYFEVEKRLKAGRMANIPFIVSSGNQEIYVLGTHFNLNAYPEEKTIKTTLLEGSVKVRQPATGKEEILHPGEQALSGHDKLTVQQADTDLAVAWKAGYFSFSESNLEQIMRGISRWYNVEVIYASDDLKRELFSGTVSRFASVSQVLRKMELTGSVSFKIEGKKIYVSKAELKH